jgi:hypothetical protein
VAQRVYGSADSGHRGLSTEANQQPGLHLWLDRSRHRLAFALLLSRSVALLGNPGGFGANLPPGSPRVGPLVLRLIPKGTSPGRQERRRAPRRYCCQEQRPVTGHGKHPNRVPQSTPLGRPRRGRPGQALSKPGASRSCWSCASPQTQLQSGHPSYRRRYPDPGKAQRKVAALVRRLERALRMALSS